jgi:hypothetical protein
MVTPAEKVKIQRKTLENPKLAKKKYSFLNLNS